MKFLKSHRFSSLQILLCLFVVVTVGALAFFLLDSGTLLEEKDVTLHTPFKEIVQNQQQTASASKGECKITKIWSKELEESYVQMDFFEFEDANYMITVLQDGTWNLSYIDEETTELYEVASGKWAEECVTLTVFYIEAVPVLFHFHANGYLYAHSFTDSEQVLEEFLVEKWGSRFRSVRPIELQDEVYVYGYHDDGRIYLSSLEYNYTVDMWAKTYRSGYEIVEPLYMKEGTFLFSYHYTGWVDISAIKPDVKGARAQWSSLWNHNHTMIIPFQYEDETIVLTYRDDVKEAVLFTLKVGWKKMQRYGTQPEMRVRVVGVAPWHTGYSLIRVHRIQGEYCLITLRDTLLEFNHMSFNCFAEQD
jgi:hypothetical protein